MDIRSFFGGKKSTAKADGTPSSAPHAHDSSPLATTPKKQRVSAASRSENAKSKSKPTNATKPTASPTHTSKQDEGQEKKRPRKEPAEELENEVSLVDSDDDTAKPKVDQHPMRRLKSGRERKAAAGAARKISDSAKLLYEENDEEREWDEHRTSKKPNEDDEDFMEIVDLEKQPDSDTDDAFEPEAEEAAPKKRRKSSPNKKKQGPETHIVPKRNLVETTADDFFGTASSAASNSMTASSAIGEKQSKYFKGSEQEAIHQSSSGSASGNTPKPKRSMPWNSPVPAEKKKRDSTESTTSSVENKPSTDKNIPSKPSDPKPKPKFSSWGGGRRGPMSSCSKELPVGAPNCLNGLSFVITGVLPSLGREDVEDFIKEYGGAVRSAVSGKTNYLLTGVELEDKRPVEEGSKYKKAKEIQESGKAIKIIDEDGLLDLVRKSNKDSRPVSDPAHPTVHASSDQTAPTIQSNSKLSSDLDKPKKSAQSASSSDELWTDKYRPMKTQEIVGGQAIVNKLKLWLQKWDATHIRKTHKYPFSKNDNMGAKAALLSGPPGIGKTTLAGVIARELGYEVFEMNASDTRNKAAVQDTLSSVVVSSTLTSQGMAGSRRLVIMDEVDGMSSSDRGGNAALIQVIKSSRTPIICICNDRMKNSVRSLVNHCLDLKVQRPQKASIAKRVVEICKMEGVEADFNAIEMLCETCGNDFRQILNTLQMWAHSTSHVSYRDMKDGLYSISKDKVLRMSAFDGAKSILSDVNTATFFERYDAYFVDYSLTPLLVQQNYVSAVEHGAKNLGEQETLERLSKAADAASDSQLCDAAVRGQDMHWELLTAQAALNVRIGFLAKGFVPFPQFPEWLGKYSTGTKHTRMAQELHSHMSLSYRGGCNSLRLEVLPYLTKLLLHPLLRASSCGDDATNTQNTNTEVQETIALLDEYGLSKDDLTENMKELQVGSSGEFERLSSKVKSALTRDFNKGVHKSQGLVHSTQVTSKKKARAPVDEEAVLQELEEGEESAVLSADEDDDNDVTVFQKKPKKRSGKEGAGAKRKGSDQQTKSKRSKK